MFVEEIADGTVTEAKLALQSVSFGKLKLTIVETGVASLEPHAEIEQLVATNVGSTEDTLYFPTVILSAAGGTGKASVEASIVYQQAAGSVSSYADIYIRLVNYGSATVNVSWSVKTFAGGFHP